MVNVGNRATLSFSGIEEQTIPFDIAKDDYYVLTFYADDQEWGDGVIGVLTLTALEYDTTGIDEIKATVAEGSEDVYSLQGIRCGNPQINGIYVKGGRRYILNNCVN